MFKAKKIQKIGRKHRILLSFAEEDFIKFFIMPAPDDDISSVFFLIHFIYAKFVPVFY